MGRQRKQSRGQPPKRKAQPSASKPRKGKKARTESKDKASEHNESNLTAEGESKDYRLYRGGEHCFDWEHCSDFGDFLRNDPTWPSLRSDEKHISGVANEKADKPQGQRDPANGHRDQRHPAVCLECAQCRENQLERELCIAELRNWKDKAQAKEDAIRDLKSELEDATERIADLESNRETRPDSCKSSFQDAVSNHTGNEDHSREQHAKASEKGQKELEKYIEVYERNEKALMDRLALFEARHEQLEEENGSLTQEIIGQKKELEQVKKTQQEAAVLERLKLQLKCEISALERSIAVVAEKELEQSRRKLAYEEEVNAIVVTCEKVMLEAKMALFQRRSSTPTSKAIVKGLQEKLQEKSKEVDETTRALSEKSREHDELKQKCAKLQENFNVIAMENTQHSTIIKELQWEIGSVRERLRESVGTTNIPLPIED